MTPSGTAELYHRVESRDVHVTGNVDVTGGTVTVGATLSYTFTPDGNQPPATISETAFPERTIAPNTGGSPFDIILPLHLPPGTSTDGNVEIKVTGTDELGNAVDELLELLISNADTALPSISCDPNIRTLCMDAGARSPGRFLADVDWIDFDGNSGAGMVTDGQRFPDGGWMNFGGPPRGRSTPTASPLFRLEDRCNDPGFNNFWVFAAATTDVEFTLTVTDTQTNQTRSYFNPLGIPAQAITDTQAVATCP
jgi:hypothetical protein